MSEQDARLLDDLSDVVHSVFNLRARIELEEAIRTQYPLLLHAFDDPTDDRVRGALLSVTPYLEDADDVASFKIDYDAAAEAYEQAQQTQPTPEIQAGLIQSVMHAYLATGIRLISSLEDPTSRP